LVLGYMRNDRAAEEATDAVREAGAERVLVRGNVASERVVGELASHGPYGVVVHNAATGVIRAALETEDKHWDWTLSANARAFLSLARAAAPDMPAGGTIVAVSSLGSTRVLENYVLVGTSKAALESLVRYLAVELAPRGIRVNAVSAGVVETDALDHFPNRDAMLRTVKRTPAGRLVEPEDVAATVAYLSSPAEAIAVARELEPAAAFVQADVHELPLELRRGRFDFVYTGGGVLVWLQDLDAWAAGVASALRTAGELLLYDAHPVLQCLDASLRWREDYFFDCVFVNTGWDHFRLSGEPAREEKHERFWRLGQVVTAVADAGLRVESLEE